MDNSGRKLYGHNGGVWEWTSTPLAGYPGYVPSELYPGYSADFFDDKHFVVVSSSSFAPSVFLLFLSFSLLGGSHGRERIEDGYL
jgi:formylglycine-generating enzyme required for sulfatase activity